VRQPEEVDGPHLLRQGDQERCAVPGQRIDGSGACTVVAIRDYSQGGWVLYPHGVASFGVLIGYDAARTFALRLGRRS
jgi:hypothetical protein